MEAESSRGSAGSDYRESLGSEEKPAASDDRNRIRAVRMAEPRASMSREATCLEHFGLREDPFGPLSNAEAFYHAEQYSLLFSELARNTECVNGRVVIYGERGSGKTLLLNRYAAGLEERVCFASIDDSCTGGVELLTSMLEQFGFEDVSGTLDQLRNITRELLIHQGKHGNPVLLIVDNVHRLPPTVLEELRWTASIRQDGEAVANMVLAGLPALANIVASPAMRDSLGRRHFRFNVRAFTEDETRDYVDHRLDAAGARDAIRFSADAYPLIYRYSGGTPGKVNSLCAAALDKAFDGESRELTGGIVRASAEELELVPHALRVQGRYKRKTDPGVRTAGAAVAPDTREAAAADASVGAGDIAPAGDASAPDEEVAALTAEIERLRADSTSAQATVDKQSTLISGLETQLADRTRAFESLAADLESGSAQMEALESEITKLTEELAGREDAVRSLAEEVEARQGTVATLEAELGERTRAFEAAAAELESGSTEASSLQGEVTRLTEELAERENAAQQLAAELEERQSIAARLEAELGDKTRAFETAASELESGSSEVSAMQAEIAKLTEELAERENAARELAADADDRQRVISELEAELEEARREAARIEELEGTCGHLRAEIEDRDREAATLKDELSSLRREQADLREQLMTASGRLAEIEPLKHVIHGLQHEADEIADQLAIARRQRSLQEKHAEKLEVRLQSSESSRRTLEERAERVARLESELGERDDLIERLRRALSNQDRALRDAHKSRGARATVPVADGGAAATEAAGSDASESARMRPAQPDPDAAEREPIHESDGRVLLTITFQDRVDSTLVRALSAMPCMIGRAEDNDVLLMDNTVSRHHALLLCRDGRLVIDDLNSTNGVGINGRRVSSGKLGFGDVVTVGDYELRLSRCEDEDAEPRDDPDEPAETEGHAGSAAELDADPANDLKRIFGIGAKTERALNELGVYRYDQLIDAIDDDVDALAIRIGASTSRIDRERWAEQAEELASRY